MGNADAGKAAEPPRRSRRWTAEEKIRIVEQTYAPGVSIGLVARCNGIAHHLLRRWRRLMKRGALTPETTDLRCAACGELLRGALRSNAKFCSSRCRQKAYRLRKSAPLWLGCVEWADMADRLLCLV